MTHDEVKLKLPNDDGYGLYLIAAEEKGGGWRGREGMGGERERERERDGGEE